MTTLQWLRFINVPDIIWIGWSVNRLSYRNFYFSFHFANGNSLKSSFLDWISKSLFCFFCLFVHNMNFIYPAWDNHRTQKNMNFHKTVHLEIHRTDFSSGHWLTFLYANLKTRISIHPNSPRIKLFQNLKIATLKPYHYTINLLNGSCLHLKLIRFHFIPQCYEMRQKTENPNALGLGSSAAELQIKSCSTLCSGDYSEGF